MEQTGIFESNSKIVFDELIEKYEEKYEEITNYLKGSKADKSEVEKKADKSEVAALKSKVHTLESQVEKLLKANEELSKSNELRVSQLQNTSRAPQGTASTIPSITETTKEPKTPSKTGNGYGCTNDSEGVTCGFEFENFGSDCYLLTIKPKKLISQKELDSNLYRAQDKALSLLKELYSISLNKSPVPDKENNLFQLYEKIHANLTTSNHIEWWKQWTCPLESRKKFTDAIISQVIISTFFDMLSSFKYDDTESLKNEIATINSSGLLCQKSQEKLNSVLGKITQDLKLYGSGYETYIRLTNWNFVFFRDYKKNFDNNKYVNTSASSILNNPAIFIGENGGIAITPADNDKIKKIISGEKSVSNSNPANGRSRY